MTKQREKIFPGSKQNFQLAGNVLNDYLQGKVPQDVVNQTSRIVAERSGGSFDPFTGGGQAQSDFARSIGKNSLDITNMGLSASPTWQQLAQSFVVNPLQVGQLALQAGQNRYAYDALNSGVALQNAQSGYWSGYNNWQGQQAVGQNQATNANNLLGMGLSGLNTAASLYGAYKTGGLGMGTNTAGQNSLISNYTSPNSNANAGGASLLGGTKFLGNYNTGA